MLLVLDDAADAAHVTPLLPAAPGCLVLITSRRKLVTLPGVALLWLDTLSPADADRLFVDRAGIGADRAQAVARLTRLCGHLPLAITLTAARLHVHPTWDVADLVEDLEQTRDRLAELASGDLAVAAAFELSYRDLPADLRRLFRRLALHPGPDLDVRAAAALHGVTVAAARRGLESLLEHNLLTEPHRGRYRFHDLIAEHARSHVAADPEPERDAAVDRLLDLYHHTAVLVAGHQQPGSAGTAPDGDPPAGTPAITDARRAEEWFTAELLNLAAATDLAAARGHPAAFGIPAALFGHLRDHGPFDLAIRLHRTAATAARHAGDRTAHARALTDLAFLHRATGGDYPAATAAAEQSLELYRELDDPAGQAAALTTLADVGHITNDFPAAAAAAEQAHALYLRIGDERGQADALTRLVAVQYTTGEFAAATAAAERVSALYERIGDRRGQANALGSLARLRHMTGDNAAAAGTAERARALFAQLGNLGGEANTLLILARIHHFTGDQATAATCAEGCRDRFARVGHEHGQAFALCVLARVQHATGDHRAATATAERAHALFEGFDDEHGRASALQVIGVVRHTTGDHPAAATALDRALTLFREVGDPEAEAETLTHLGRLELDTAGPAAAHDRFVAALHIARRLGIPGHTARALEGIGECLIRAGSPGEGAEHLREALGLYRRTGSRTRPGSTPGCTRRRADGP
jgi:tetratricopeptide (TPR) repeat protein